MTHLRVRGKRRNRIHWAETFVKRARRRARCHRCGKPDPIIGQSISGDSVTSMIRAGGAGVREVKTRIREGGWVCRKCYGSQPKNCPTTSFQPEVVNRGSFEDQMEKGREGMGKYPGTLDALANARDKIQDLLEQGP